MAFGYKTWKASDGGNPITSNPVYATAEGAQAALDKAIDGSGTYAGEVYEDTEKALGIQQVNGTHGFYKPWGKS